MSPEEENQGKKEPSAGLPIFVKGEDGQWVPLRNLGRAPTVRKPVAPAELQTKLCRFAVAAAVASLLGPFTYGILSIAALVLGVVSLRRLRATDESITGKKLAIAALSLAGLTLLIQLLIGPFSLRTTSEGCVAFFQPELPLVIRATQGARQVRENALQWRENHGGTGCPSIADLVRDRLLASSRTQDPWGQTYSILCKENTIVVQSSGPDSTKNTADDISVQE